MKNVLSLGAGVQSSTVLLMSCRGVLPKLDAAIFADTQWEPKAVYEYLEAVLIPACQTAHIPLYIVSAGNILKDWVNKVSFDDRAASIPFFTEPKPTAEKEGRLGRQCTKEYKVEPVRQKLRELWPEDRFYLWYGISGDEMRRMRFSTVNWIENYYPLIFGLDRPYHRVHCQAWLESQGFPQTPRSSCIGCPNHDDDEWRAIKARPEEWRQAVMFDTLIRHIPKIEQPAFVHRSCVPLEEIDFSTAEDRGQGNWISECEGGCGV